jgi:hypothetical protein
MKVAPKLSKTKPSDPVGESMKKQHKEPTVNVVLTAKQFNIVMAGLGELPHKHVGNLINELVAQVQPQVEEKPPAKASKAPPASEE